MHGLFLTLLLDLLHLLEFQDLLFQLLDLVLLLLDAFDDLLLLFFFLFDVLSERPELACLGQLVLLSDLFVNHLNVALKLLIVAPVLVLELLEARMRSFAVMSEVSGGLLIELRIVKHGLVLDEVITDLESAFPLRHVVEVVT